MTTQLVLSIFSFLYIMNSALANTDCKSFISDISKVNSAKGIFTLADEEISELISLIDRVKPSLIRVDSITSEQRVYIKAASCGFTPNKWTVTFN